jgi:hypothetical protein
MASFPVDEREPVVSVDDHPGCFACWFGTTFVIEVGLIELAQMATKQFGILTRHSG